MHVAHVGDSRCYRLRSGHLELLTQDHSLLTDVLEQRPDLDDEVLARLPKNAVTRALGMDSQLRVSLRSYAVVQGDRYLLCSDGLSGPVPAPEIARALAADRTPLEIAEHLIVHCQGGHIRAVPADNASPPPPDLFADAADRDADYSNPELLILGIEEADVSEGMESASDGLLKSLGDLLGPGRK
jgi:protein phosphatase